MRINKYLSLASSLSRRQADAAIAQGRVAVNGLAPAVGQEISDGDTVTLDGKAITPAATRTIMLNKPVGYVCSRNGQGSRTIYDLLPPECQQLNPVGRLDKVSSGLLLLTNDGKLAHELTHPSQQKPKTYEIQLDKLLTPPDRSKLTETGVSLEDGLSKFDELQGHGPNDGFHWLVVIHEGRNRQIRRTFAALGYTVTALHRTHFGPYALGELAPGMYKNL